jgi:glycosyltransferase involved in cell wall biosynthesis
VNKRVEISIITPCYNEEENVEICALELENAMANYLPKISYEHIFVDNNSTDSTFEKLSLIAKKDKRIKLIRNSRNVGSFNSVWIGMQNSSGKYVVPSLCADLQDPPLLIPKMYESLKTEKALIVYGVMEKREEKFVLKRIRKLYYYLINKLAYTYIPRDSGEFLIADSRVVNSVLATNDCYPYIRGLFAQANVKSIAIPYERVKRLRGTSKENFYQLINHSINGFISTSVLLPKLMILSGLLLAIISAFMAVYNVIGFFITENKSIDSGIPTILISIFFFNSIQLLFLGMIGEYIQAIYKQVRQSPHVFSLDRVNFDKFIKKM